MNAVFFQMAKVYFQGHKKLLLNPDIGWQSHPLVKNTKMYGARLKANANQDKTVGFSLRKMLATAKINPILPQSPTNNPRLIPCRLSEPWTTEANKHPKSSKANDKSAQMALRCLLVWSRSSCRLTPK
jgi:hypothetical protein